MSQEVQRESGTGPRTADRAGELVSNAPLRARCEWLLQYDPEFSIAGACVRMVDQGYPKFIKRSGARGERWVPDTSHFQRILGMRDRPSSLHHGRSYPSRSRTEWISYDLAVAVARALYMDPVDAGV